MNSTIKTLTSGDLERALTQVGFVVERPNHAYQVFRYASLEILIVLPSRRGDDSVDAAHLLAVRTHVIKNGVLDTAAFDTLLQVAETDLVCPSSPLSWHLALTQISAAHEQLGFTDRNGLPCH